MGTQGAFETITAQMVWAALKAICEDEKKSRIKGGVLLAASCETSARSADSFWEDYKASESRHLDTDGVLLGNNPMFQWIHQASIREIERRMRKNGENSGSYGTGRIGPL